MTTAPLAAPHLNRKLAGTAAVALVLATAGLALAFVPLDVLPGARLLPDVAMDFPPGQQARSEAYRDGVRPAAYTSLLLSLLAAGVLGLTRLGSGLVRRCSSRWWLQVPFTTLALVMIGSLLTLPLGLRVWSVQRDAGLSTRAVGGFLLDRFLTAVVESGLSAVALLVALAIARRSPRAWWAWGAGSVAALVAAGSFLYPVVVEPVFNSFSPLPAGQLRDDLLALASAQGVPVEDVLVADASKRTSGLNAYVSGLGSSRRIVLYDTLLQQAPPAEVRVIVAHELGHASQDDVLRGTILGMFGAASAVCVLALLLSWQPLLRRAGAAGPGDPRVVPLVLFLVATGTVLVTPAVNQVSRQVEQRADLRALQATGDADALISSVRRLSLTNLSDLEPDVLSRALSGSHPTAPERIAFARAWAERTAR